MIQKLCVMGIISTNVVNTTSTNVSTNSDGKKVRYRIDCYILQRVLLMIILLFIIAIICYHYGKHRSKLKIYCRADNKKIENNEFFFALKIVRVIISMT